MTHHCGNHEMLSRRLVLAVLDSNQDGFDDVLNDLGDCLRCHRLLTGWLAHRLAGDFAIQAGSTAKAAKVAASDLARVLMSDG